MTKKKVVEKVDGGLNSKQLTRLRAAIRDVWRYSYARKLCEQRAMTLDGFSFCEECKKIVPKTQIDHIVPCGDVLSPGYIDRMFCPSTGLQALCPTCHKAKTKIDNAKTKEKKSGKAKTKR